MLLLFVLVLAALTLSLSVQSSPGAHGPNGEHLDTEKTNSQTQRPKFEAFTESFELLGEVFRTELIVYLHDFETNTPIQFASIELETGALAASATYDEAQNRYIVNAPKFLASLNEPGEHEVIATIMTDDNGDLLVANLVMPQDNQMSTAAAHSHDGDHDHDTSHTDEEEHHHFPWWALALVIIFFVLGFYLGRKKRGAQS
ncbi:hypothetical protein [Glaciecola sp. SC05]|uniref:hypothetical protein n=1 Tax=Glaciecola sp. SC05 TaxID=1987355 RepID=UPI0035272B56